jgi:D-3-phosphoglycerate dehydrogenase
MSAFGTRLIAYDPYISTARAAQIGVKLVSLDELLRDSDFISIHLPKTPETVGLIGKEQLALCKPTVRIINAARGGLVDEQALADALAGGQVAGAGIDVFATEPCTDSPLFAFDSVVVSPHLGASTVEAQDKAGIAVARSVRLALEGEFVPDAVNVQAGGVVVEEVRPALPLVEKLGRVFTALAGGVAATLEVEVRGEITAYDVSVLQLAALKGVFADVVEEQVTFVNAPALATERGVEVSLTTDPDSPDFRSLITVRGVLPTGLTVSVAGTLSGPRQIEKITDVDGFDVDIVPSDHLLFFRYADKPGIVGTVGAALGEAHINIAGAQVSRTSQGGDALMALTVDSAVPGAVLDRIATAIGAQSARSVDLA